MSHNTLGSAIECITDQLLNTTLHYNTIKEMMCYCSFDNSKI